ncbi:hypothetical protein J1614_006468 [Plenodomus biglobosus]|nr:hypothetical protein J1614_006468 [Plenodomus biglobosus]
MRRLRSNDTPTFSSPHAAVRAVSFPGVPLANQQTSMIQHQEAARLPEFLTLAGVPLYPDSAPDDFATHTSSLDNTLRSSESTTDLTGYCSPDQFSITTPEPIHCNQPCILGTDICQPNIWEPWPEDLLPPSADVHNSGSSATIPNDSWSTIECNLPLWSQLSVPLESASILADPTLQMYPGCERVYTPGGYSSLGFDLNDWQDIQNAATYMTSEHLVSTVPLFGDTMNHLPYDSNWEDKFAVELADTLIDGHYPEERGYYLHT